MKYILLLFIITAFSCGNFSITNIKNVGVILDANEIPTLFNEHITMRIKTDKMIIIITDVTSVPLGDSAYIGKGTWFGETRNYMSWKSSNKWYQIY